MHHPHPVSSTSSPANLAASQVIVSSEEATATPLLAASSQALGMKGTAFVWGGYWGAGQEAAGAQDQGIGRAASYK